MRHVCIPFFALPISGMMKSIAHAASMRWEEIDRTRSARCAKNGVRFTLYFSLKQLLLKLAANATVSK